MLTRPRSTVWTWYALVLFFRPGVQGAPPDLPSLEFTREPPGQVDFSNNTGTRIECQVGGTTLPTSVSWIFPDSTPVTNLTGLRRVSSDGALVFLPFSSEAFRQDVHAVSYKCSASNSAGTIVTPDVKVKAVMDVDYDFSVYDVFAIRGNTAVIKCHIPSFLQNLVAIVAYIRDDSLKIATPIQSDAKFSLSPSGALYIKDVGPTDAGTSYRCQILPRFNGHVKTSSTVGRLFVNEPHGNVPPKIVDSVSTVEGQEGNLVVLPCVAQGFPTPVVQWYVRSVVGDLLLGAQNGAMKRAAHGLVFPKVQLSDSGTYVCRANNTVGSDQVEVTLSVTAPLRVEVKPRVEAVDIGQSLRLECAVSGFPVSSVWWLRNGQPLVGGGRVVVNREVVRIDTVGLEDKGLYQCFARNEKETAQGVGEVRLGDFAPVLRETFATASPTNPGGVASLTCVAAGNPPPEINWTLDTLPLEPNSRLAIENVVSKDGHTVSTLKLPSTVVEDGGVYTCVAGNIHGKVRHSDRLNIYGM